MKNRIYHLFLLIVYFSLLGSDQISAQGTKLYGMKDLGAPLMESFVSYDITTGVLDTVIDFQGEVSTSNFWSAMDVYNGRYFFGGGHDSLPGYRIFSINIFDNNIQVSPPFYGFIGDLDYDIYLNKLYINNHSELRSYDLQTFVLDTLCSLPEATGSIYGSNHALNVNTQELMYLNYDSGVKSYVVVNVLSQTVISNMDCQSFVPGNIVFDPVSGRYFGTINSDVIEFDPQNGVVNILLTFPGFWGHLNSERADFDSYNGFYVVPYLSTSFESRIVVIDMNNYTIVSDEPFPANDQNRLYSRPQPVIKFDGTELMAVYGVSYQWYLNGSQITNATSQSNIPSQSGFYKCEVLFMDGRKEFSNEIFINPSSIIPVTENSFYLFPNPANESLKIDVGACQNPSRFLISDLSGKIIVENLIDENNKVILMDCSVLNNGMYFVQIFSGKDVLSKEKLIIVR